ncbi:MAG TPA: cytochrome c biogenesis protein ResB, partial [Anaeromyxobacteraceae bacterium]|nr:cytochrome c biogenesis protein ResB [Anaeromyxobacteraceae bacterium]
MKKLLEALASLKLAVGLLVLLLLGLAAGTIVESSRGTEVAGRLVYYSWWFLALQGALVVNVVASLAQLFPWGEPRVGFLTTHAAVVLILVGATVSYFFKQEGQLTLWEGQRGNEVVKLDKDGNVLERFILPFYFDMERFRIDHYQGTMRPSNFRSEVRVVDAAAGRVFPAAIWMNHPFDYRGWRFFQSSYQQQGGRSATVLSVSKDPGEPIVFVGYGL